jgi:hypothetical protein
MEQNEGVLSVPIELRISVSAARQLLRDGSLASSSKVDIRIDPDKLRDLLRDHCDELMSARKTHLIPHVS